MCSTPASAPKTLVNQWLEETAKAAFFRFSAMGGASGGEGAHLDAVSIDHPHFECAIHHNKISLNDFARLGFAVKPG